MKIIYLTNSMISEDFDALNETVSVKANPSNQNFHARLIKAFSLHHAVIALSYRPLANYNDPNFLPYEWKKDQKITYHYLPIHNRRYTRQQKLIDYGMTLIGKLMKTVKKDKPFLVVDGLNATLRHLALKASRKHGLKTILVVTDNPYLLSGSKEKTARAAIKQMSKFDYFIPLTPALDILVNPLHRPHLNLPGIAEGREYYSQYQRPYFFFAGALHERYGINNLITAFQGVTYDVDLLIAGHGPDHFVRQASAHDERIKFLGQLAPSEIFKYESGALLNINPRPFDRVLNDYSIPSKFFEYMTSGVPTMSTEHAFLTSKYAKLAIWAGQGSPTDLKMGLVEFMGMAASTRDRMAKKAQEAVLEEYGIEAVGTALAQFTKSLR